MAAAARHIITKALAHIPAPGQNTPIYLALSGGVDSSVAGFLLRERGYDVKPTLLRCWESSDDPKTSCFEQEMRDVEAASNALKLQHDVKVLDLVSAYWTNVFDKELLKGLIAGRTPNADLACNRHIKFGAFPDHIRKTHGPDAIIATGHYARLRQTPDGMQLLAAVDARKDQSYFLASVQSASLEQVILPIGPLLKSEVRSVAHWVGLPAAAKTSSRGMCFIGKRAFPAFIDQFVDGHPGQFVLADTGTPLAPCEWPAWAYTVGQRARIGGMEGPMFVVGRREGDVVVTHRGDPRRYTRRAVCPCVDWVGGQAPRGIDEGMRVGYKMSSAAERRYGRMWREDGALHVMFDAEEKRVSEGQALVLYDEETCLGAAWPVDNVQKVMGGGERAHSEESTVVGTNSANTPLS